MTLDQDEERMDHKNINRLIAVAIFFVSLVTYVRTLSPTVVFWDVGEFCAAAFLLQVPHPPGAPLFLLIARLFSMVPFASDIAVRMHFISALASALTVMFLYLISVRFMMMWRGKPATMYDRLVLYGSAAVGALSLAFSKTFWFNAVEAEVYGLSMLFVSAIFWLALRWYERADWERSDVYLILIAYLIGLSVGVHLLALLTLFSVMLLFYFRHYEWSIESFLKFGVASVAVFGLIYPGVVKWLPSLLDGEMGGTKSEIFTLIPFAALTGALYGIYRSAKTHHRVLHVALLSFVLIVLGYSTYAVVYIRANAKPPMNENNPSNLARLVSYLNREQYGTAPLLQRRWSTEPEHQENHRKYTSDFDFLWRYQMNHMYLRYLGWNYIGTEGDWKEAGVSLNQLYAIPFFLGLFGAFHHWRKDKKMAFVATTFFLLMGAVLVIYFNMQEPQPRERDYFYVGSFFVFSMWVGMGVAALLDLLKEKLGDSPTTRNTSLVVVAAAFALVPVNMLRTNFHEADRTGNFVAYDYSYNTLQSCEPDAILFTNGDNDTFPLWYLQDVEGIRRDIRIVNLSLLNTNWYIHQLKNEEPHGAKKVPISLTDGVIETIQPLIPFEPRQYQLAVPPEVLREYGVTDTSITNHNAIPFFFNATLQYGEYKGIRVQDILVYDIVKTNGWKRPIYFAMTVSDDGKIGLQDYLQWEGLTFRLVPKRTGAASWAGMNAEKMEKLLLSNKTEPVKTPEPGFLWRNLNDSTVYFDEDARRMMVNYRQTFLALCGYFLNVANQPQKVIAVLDSMEKFIPSRVIAMPLRMKMVVANYYQFAGNRERFTTLTQEIIDEVKPILERGTTEELSIEHPYLVLLQTYALRGEYDEALALLDRIKQAYPLVPGIDEFVSQQRRELESQRTAAAASKADTLPPVRTGKK
jgi:hypothetical protein